MKTEYQYRIWCETDQQYETVWAETEPTECPIDPGHTINATTIVIIDERQVAKYEIENDVEDVIAYNKDVHSINYKTELKSGIAYTPEYVIYTSGSHVGHIEKTNYYRNYVDENNKGDLVLVVEETYVMDDSDLTLNYTARPCLSRTKTWKHVKISDGLVDDVNIKTRTKLYNTRRKRRIEAIRRRENVIEQLIDHVGLAGVLSGSFVDADEAYDELTSMQELHAASFEGWISSGRGSLIDVVQNDATTTWLDDVIPDNPTNQAMIPWMIGLTFRAYIQEKLKGNID